VYIVTLTAIVAVFLTPLRAAGIIPDKDVKKIFSNLEVIHNINSQMLKELEKRVRLSLANNVTSIGDIFTSMVKLQLNIYYLDPKLFLLVSVSQNVHRILYKSTIGE